MTCPMLCSSSLSGLLVTDRLRHAEVIESTRSRIGVRRDRLRCVRRADGPPYLDYAPSLLLMKRFLVMEPDWQRPGSWGGGCGWRCGGHWESPAAMARWRRNRVSAGRSRRRAAREDPVRGRSGHRSLRSRRLIELALSGQAEFPGRPSPPHGGPAAQAGPSDVSARRDRPKPST